MANGNPASFFPVIGSGFPDVMQQQRGWALTNLDVQNQNFGRAAQAEQARNSWLAQLAQLQRSDAATQQAQMDRDQAAMERQGQLESSAEATGYGRRLAAEAAKEDKRRFQIESDLRAKALDVTKQKEQDAIDVADTVAEQLSPRVSSVGKQLEHAAKYYTTAIADIDKAGVQIASETPGTQYNNRSRQIEPANKWVPIDAATLTSANLKLADHRATFDTAKAEHDLLSKQLANLDAQIQNQGLLRLEDYSVFNPHPQSKKKFGGIKLDVAERTATPAPYFPKAESVPKLFDVGGSPLNAEQFATANADYFPTPRSLQPSFASSFVPQTMPSPQRNILPVPVNRADLIAGQIYQTKRGPATWDGQQFVQ